MPNRIVQASLVAVIIQMNSHGQGLADGQSNDIPRSRGREATLLEHDCGVVGEAKLAIHEYRYRNQTASTVRVANVGVTCGCLKVIDPANAIGPGESGTFRLELSLKGYAGPVSQSASVTFRDDNVPPLVLRIKAVAPGLQIRPALVDFGRLRAGNVATKDAKLVVAGLPDARITDISSNDDRLTASFDEIEVDSKAVAKAMAPMADVRVHLRVDSADDVGKFEGLLLIRTNVPGQEILKLPVRAHVVGEYDARPEAAFFGTVRTGKSILRTIALVPSAREAPAEMGRTTTVSVDHDEVSAEIMEAVEAGDKRKLVLRCSPDARTPNGILRGRIIGRADGKIVFAVPYVAFVNRP